MLYWGVLYHLPLSNVILGVPKIYGPLVPNDLGTPLVSSNVSGGGRRELSQPYLEIPRIEPRYVLKAYQASSLP